MRTAFVAVALIFGLGAEAQTSANHRGCMVRGVGGGAYWDCASDDAEANYWRHRSDLAHALTTRVLTPKEMGEVLEEGSLLFTPLGQSFFQKDVDEKFLTALAVQRELRAMAAQDKCR